VLTGGLERSATPQLGQAVADGIPGARFEVVPEEGHRPFVEAADEFNDRVDGFWREIEQPTTSPEQPAHTA
jgi:pimeloyl-ACP methyl ester carboxylesterase